MRCTKNAVLSILCVAILIFCRMLSFITTPLWLDFFKNHNTTNTTNSSSHGGAFVEPYSEYTISCDAALKSEFYRPYEKSDVDVEGQSTDPGSFHSSSGNNSSRNADTHDTFPFFIALLQAVVPFVFWTSVLIAIRICFPHQITDFEKNYPKKFLVIPGFAQALSTMLVIYASSGTRTALYIQAIINNFTIPIQFLARLLILRKWPTRLKLICAGTVVVAEFLCLLPSIVPSLETAKQRSDNGGASGAGAILWPMCFVASMIPYVVANSLMERGVKDSNPSDATPSSADPQGPDTEILVYSNSVQASHAVRSDLYEENSTANEADGRPRTGYSIPNSTLNYSAQQLHMAYYLSWYCACLSFGIMSLFWMDLIPGFGTSGSIQEFGEKMRFNVLCIVGQEEQCGVGISVLGWVIVLANFGGFTVIPFLLRYSEGANFMIVAQALRSPLLFLFWTLFDEPPFKWYPHVSLSTWLSIGALVIMVPAVITYNMSAPEHVGKKFVRPEDREPLLESTGEFSE